MKKLTFSCLLFMFLAAASGYSQSLTAPDSETPTYLIIRTDDLGMSHSVNMALKKLLDTGFPVSVSVMFPCPWYQETVAILKGYDDKNVSVGIHLTLNSEWQYYRWGPITGREAVPSLVDEDGYFFHSAATLYENNPSPSEVEKELRAQIERALKTGLQIDYVDYHMGTAMGNPMFREITEKLAGEYNLGLWGYFEARQWDPQYRATPEDKTDSLVAMVNELTPGYNYLITHVGIDNAELSAMRDMNMASPLAAMSANRQGELNALTSKAFAKALKKKNIKLVTFKDLMDEMGLANIKDASDSD